MYSLRPKILVIEMDVSRCILVLDTSILMTSNSRRREYLVQTRNKVGVGEFSMYIGLGTNKKERGVVQTGHPTGLLVEKGNIGETLYKVVWPGLDLLSTHRSRWLE